MRLCYRYSKVIGGSPSGNRYRGISTKFLHATSCTQPQSIPRIPIWVRTYSLVNHRSKLSLIWWLDSWGAEVVEPHITVKPWKYELNIFEDMFGLRRELSLYVEALLLLGSIIKARTFATHLYHFKSQKIILHSYHLTPCPSTHTMMRLLRRSRIPK